MTDQTQRLGDAMEAIDVDPESFLEHLVTHEDPRDGFTLTAAEFKTDALAEAIAATEAGAALLADAEVGAAVPDRTPGETARGYMRAYGFVFDRWPPGVEQPASRLDDFDDVTRWQGFAFSLYTDLCKVETAIRKRAAREAARAG